MALKDLKSDLSKFRMPKKDPLESKERVTVNKNLNKTPLSSMVESAPKIPRSQTTTNKEGVNPKNMDNTSKFLGETTPIPSNNSEKFLGETTTKPLSLEERYLGETTPTTSDNTSKFLGETTPTKFDNQSNFLGEITPSKFDNQSNFLGETTPNKFDNNENFLGLTTPTLSNRESRFLGETTPNSADNTSKFLGETTPNSADNTSKFLGETTQTPSNNTSKFLGETTPKDVNYITDIHAKGFNSKFGATLPANSKFTGVAKNQEVWNNNSIYGKLKAVNFFPIETSKARGFSLNQVHQDETKFTGIKRGLNEITADDKDAFNENSSLYSKLKAVDFFPIETSKARGFSLNEFQLAPSQFTGVSKDQTKWSTISSEYSSFSKYTHPNLSTVKAFGGNPSGAKQRNNKNNTYYLDSFQAGNFAVDLTKGKLPDETKWSTDLSEYSSFSKYMHPNLSTVKAFGGNPTGKKQRNNKNNTYYLDSFQTGNFASDLTKGKLPDETKWSTDLSEYSSFSKYIHPDLSSAPGYGKFKLQKQASGQKQSYNQDSTYYMDSFQRGDFALDLTKGKISKLQEMRNSPSFLDEMYSKFNLKEDSFNAGLGLFRQPFILRGIQRKKISKGEPQVWGLGGFNYDEGAIRGGIVTSTVRALIDVARIGSWFASIPGVLWGAKQFGMQRTNRFGKIWTPVGMLAAIGGQHIGLKPNRVIPTLKYETILSVYKIAENAGFLLKKAAANVAGYETLDIAYAKTKDFKYKFKNDTDFNFTGGAWKSDIRGGFNSTYGINFSGPSNHKRYVNTFVNPEKVAAAKTADFKQKFNPTQDFAGPPLLPPPENLYPAQSEVQAGAATGDTVSDISQQLETRVNFGNPGRRVPSGGILIENRVDWTNTDPKNKEFLNRFDKVNAVEKGASVVNDLIHLWFKAEGGSRVQFRGTVAGITDTFSPSWDSVKYNGRADQAYQYKTFERSLSFTFKVYATSRIEMMPIYKKLSYLASMTMPQYHGSAGYNGTLLKFRLGSLFQNHLAFIESLSYSMSDETPWDIALDNTVGELPMGIDVSIGLKILPKTGTQVPKLGSKNYDTIF